MPIEARRIGLRAVKSFLTYDVTELAACLGVHKNTVRNWRRDGLEPIDGNRPILFLGATVRAFLAKRKARRRTPCNPGTLYCFRCRAPRRPALGMVDFVPLTEVSGNVRAICAVCETVMHRRAAKASLPVILPGCDVQIVQASKHLNGSDQPSLNCDRNKDSET